MLRDEFPTVIGVFLIGLTVAVVIVIVMTTVVGASIPVLHHQPPTTYKMP